MDITMRRKSDICLYGAGAKGRQTLYLLRKKGIELIAFINHLNKDYQFYLRQIILSGNSRTGLYAI